MEGGLKLRVANVVRLEVAGQILFEISAGRSG
jgi:hypothetical protein